MNDHAREQSRANEADERAEARALRASRACIPNGDSDQDRERVRACAPEMLEALKALRVVLCDPHDGEPCFDGSDGDRAVARAAFAIIDRAEGKS